MQHFKFNKNKSIDLKNSTHSTTNSNGIFYSTNNTSSFNSKNAQLPLSIKKNKNKKIPLFLSQIKETPIRHKPKIKEYIKLSHSDKKVIIKKPIEFSPKFSILKTPTKRFNTLNGYVSLNNLFSLPSIYKKRKIKNIPMKKCFSVKRCKNKDINYKNIFKRNGIQTEIEDKNKNKNKKATDVLLNYMKSKYYEDVEERMNKKLSGNYFMDTASHDKIVELNKIGIFWNSVCDFCTPIIFAQKYRYLRKTLNNLEEKKY